MAECKQIIDTLVQTVRDLSMGLRPSLLDESGLGAALEWREVVLLRAFCKYLRQAGITFSQEYMEDTLANNPGNAYIEHWNCTSGYDL